MPKGMFLVMDGLLLNLVPTQNRSGYGGNKILLQHCLNMFLVSNNWLIPKFTNWFNIDIKLGMKHEQVKFDIIFYTMFSPNCIWHYKDIVAQYFDMWMVAINFVDRKLKSDIGSLTKHLLNWKTKLRCIRITINWNQLNPNIFVSI